MYFFSSMKQRLEEKTDKNNQVPWEKVKDRDGRYGVETSTKKVIREGIESVKVHGDADGCWKKLDGNY